MACPVHRARAVLGSGQSVGKRTRPRRHFQQKKWFDDALGARPPARAPAPKLRVTPATATLTAIPSTSQKADATITFVDSLTATAGGMVFGGQATFKDGTRVMGVSSVNVRGRATLITSIAGPLGTHSITAFYTGNLNFNGSTSNTLLYTITASSPAELMAASLLGANLTVMAPSPAVSPTVVGFATAPHLHDSFEPLSTESDGFAWRRASP